MTWTVDWSPVAERDVLRMHWQLAARICRAVLLFAEQGIGEPEITEHASVKRLRVPGAVALFRPETETRTLYVLRIYASR
jgi:mRNA-degrading endonuclease RelE of RelBE toxin-antitoxin system